MGASINSINESTFEEWFLNTVDPDTIVKITRIGSWDCEPLKYFSYSDTSLLYERFAKEIWELAIKIASIKCNDGVIQITIKKGGAIDTPENFEWVMVMLAIDCLAYKSVLIDADEKVANG